MDTLEAIRTRRAIRAYEQRPVERALIEAIIRDAACAPPPFKGQVPWTFNVIEGADRVAELGARAKDYGIAHRTDGGTSRWLDNPDFKFFWDAPVVIVISGPLQDCCRAGQTLMLSAHARGLGTCWVGAPMPWLVTPEAKAELQIPTELTPVSVLCLGYPREIPDAPAPAKPDIIWSPSPAVPRTSG